MFLCLLKSNPNIFVLIIYKWNIICEIGSFECRVKRKCDKTNLLGFNFFSCNSALEIGDQAIMCYVAIQAFYKKTFFADVFIFWQNTNCVSYQINGKIFSLLTDKSYNKKNS